MANKIMLSRTQLDKISKILDSFPNINMLYIESSSTGIGPIVKVKFNVFSDDNRKSDTEIDITEVENW
jgi:hypothetical protein